MVGLQWQFQLCIHFIPSAFHLKLYTFMDNLELNKLGQFMERMSSFQDIIAKILSKIYVYQKYLRIPHLLFFWCSGLKQFLSFFFIKGSYSCISIFSLNLSFNLYFNERLLNILKNSANLLNRVLKNVKCQLYLLIM